MTAEEGKKQKIGNYRQYFRAFSGKLNFAPPTEKSDWYQTMSVPVMNGRLPYIDPYGGNGGDDVGVVEAWSRPEAEELTPENIEAIKNEVAKAEWRQDVRAGMWVGKAIAPIIGLDPELDKDQIKQIIRELIFQKVLKTTPGKTRDRKSCVFVVPGDGSAPFLRLAPNNEVAQCKKCPYLLALRQFGNWRK
jgi:hypothetical protein